MSYHHTYPRLVQLVLGLSFLFAPLGGRPQQSSPHFLLSRENLGDRPLANPYIYLSLRKHRFCVCVLRVLFSSATCSTIFRHTTITVVTLPGCLLTFIIILLPRLGSVASSSPTRGNRYRNGAQLCVGVCRSATST